ncbi:hypothetical protein PMAYCL1PPCAC_10559, partial [Pristionchus mayeri]
SVFLSLLGPEMEFLALPNVVHRAIMERVELEDRLTLRLTCRALRKLVAESRAYSARGSIRLDTKQFVPERSDDVSILVQIAEYKRMRWVEVSEEGLIQFHAMSRNIFTGISFGYFMFDLRDLDDAPFVVDFIRNLVNNFKIEDIRFQVESQPILDKALQILAKYPDSECTMHLWFLPETDQLLAIPQIKRLRISDIPDGRRDMFEVFVMLLKSNSLTYFDIEMELTTAKLRQVMQMLSCENRKRRVQFTVNHDSMIRSLGGFGIDQSTKVGHICDELEVVLVWTDSSLMQLRYRRCLIEISRLDWMVSRIVNVDIENCDANGR